MKIFLSPNTLLRSRPFFLVVFALSSAVALTLLCSIVPIPGEFGTAPPVHAFSRQTRDAGATTFREKGCVHCHGVEGVGTDRGPELLSVGRRWKKDRIEKQIREGGGGMPPFGDALQPDEIKNLVDYLAAKRKIAKPPAGVEPPIGAKTPADDSGF